MNNTQDAEEFTFLVMCLSQARREDGLTTEKNRNILLERVIWHIAQFKPSAIGFTEFHRNVSGEFLEEFTHVLTERGYLLSLDYKKDVPLEEQADGLNATHPMSFATVVYTRLAHATLSRIFLSKQPTNTPTGSGGYSNGGILMEIPGKRIMMAHLTLSFGKGPNYECFLKEVQRIRSLGEDVIFVGDLNITDSVALQLSIDDKSKTNKLLPFLVPHPTQPDFVASQKDIIASKFLVPEEQLPNGITRGIVESSADGEKVRIVSTLSLGSVGWDAMRFFHPVDSTEITGWTHEAVAEHTRKLEEEQQYVNIFDHVIGVFTIL